MLLDVVLLLFRLLYAVFQYLNFHRPLHGKPSPRPVVLRQARTCGR
jgi:hypothetical protein